MKKQLNVDLIQSELRGGSAFFPGYKGGVSPSPSSKPLESQKVAQSTPNSNYVVTNHTILKQVSRGVPPPVPRTVPRTDPRPDYLVPKVKRLMKQRQPFDIYEDQYIRLKQIADSERGFVNGRGISQMVREAIDTYLATNASSNKK